MCVRFRAVDAGRRPFLRLLNSPTRFNHPDGKRIRNDGGPAQPKCNWNRARHSIWQRSGTIARHVFARIHLRCRFPSWSPRYIHVPEVPLHDTVGFLHRLGEIPNRRPVLEKRQRFYQRFCQRGFPALGKTRSECKNPTVSCKRSVFDEPAAAWHGKRQTARAADPDPGTLFVR